ncbi:MAG: alpha amylase family protein, partial [bacterium]
SESTRKLFETSLGSGEKVQWWPEDIYAWQFVDEDWQVVPGTYFQKWIEFRSKSIRTFVKRLVEEIHKTDPTLPVGNFVGAWYPTYYEYGVNWASESHPSEEEWASRKYYETAIADLLDYLIVGCYFPRISMAEAEKVGAEWWMSVEGSAINSMEVVNKVCPVYASILVELFKSNSNEFKNALSVVLSQTNGLYIYDLSYVEKNNFWDEITEVLESGARIQSKLNFK